MTYGYIYALILVRLFGGLLDGVLHLIDHGFAHGDLKPENVLVIRGASARWMVADFGTTAGSTVYGRMYHRRSCVEQFESTIAIVDSKGGHHLMA